MESFRAFMEKMLHLNYNTVVTDNLCFCLFLEPFAEPFQLIIMGTYFSIFSQEFLTLQRRLIDSWQEE